MTYPPFKFDLGEIVLIDPARAGDFRAIKAQVIAHIRHINGARLYRVSTTDMGAGTVVRHEVDECEITKGKGDEQ